MPRKVPTFVPRALSGSDPGRDYRRDYERSPQRQEDNAFYWSMPWRRLRAWFIRQPENVLCVECRKEGRYEVAKVVDHIIPRRQRPDLALEPSNLQGLCSFHHGAKRARERRAGGG